MSDQQTSGLARRPCLSDALTEGEINQCLRSAFKALSEEDQANIKRAIGPLLAIRNMGLASALRVLFVTTQAKKLDCLDAALTNSVPQDAGSVMFSHHLGGDGEADCARRD